MITNPLHNIIPARHRQRVYALIALAALVATAWQAAQGDWTEVAVALIVALANSTAASNTDTGVSPPGEDLDHGGD